MLIDILAALSAGAGIAGIVLALRWVSRSRLPRWTIPAALGAGIIAFSAWSEYSWFPRVKAALPEEVVILEAPRDAGPFRPWGYIFPVSVRFMALDRTSLKTSEVNPAIRLADLMLVQRWMATKRIPLGFDCAAGRHTDLIGGATLAPDGTLTGGVWVIAEPGDAMQAAACREG